MTRGWHIAGVRQPDPMPGPDFRGWTVSYQGWKPCSNWCEEQFTPDVWQYEGEGIFKFMNEADRTLFLLRWS